MTWVTFNPLHYGLGRWRDEEHLHFRFCVGMSSYSTSHQALIRQGTWGVPRHEPGKHRRQAMPLNQYNRAGKGRIWKIKVCPSYWCPSEFPSLWNGVDPASRVGVGVGDYLRPRFRPGPWSELWNDRMRKLFVRLFHERWGRGNDTQNSRGQDDHEEWDVKSREYLYLNSAGFLWRQCNDCTGRRELEDLVS